MTGVVGCVMADEQREKSAINLTASRRFKESLSRDNVDIWRRCWTWGPTKIRRGSSRRSRWCDNDSWKKEWWRTFRKCSDSSRKQVKDFQEQMMTEFPTISKALIPARKTDCQAEAQVGVSTVTGEDKGVTSQRWVRSYRTAKTIM